MPGIATTCATGWYGKLPARGDFICRRLPGALVRRWDAWLQSALSSGSERLGSRWRDHYSRAPVWRFMLAPGIVSEAALAGVMMPSADRVGRMFPLTIASALAPRGVDLAETLFEAEAWFVSIEAVARAALDPGLDLDTYDERIGATVFPAGNVVPLKTGEPARAQPVEAIGLRAIHARIGPGQELRAQASIDRLRAWYGRQTAPCALWLTRGSKTFGDWALASTGLPEGEQFCAMMDGDWQQHGWS